MWSQRLGCEIVRRESNSDPAAVAYEGVQRAVAAGADYLIVDTAGRLQTQKNLMDELGKIRRVMQKVIPLAPHESLLVLDATTGQNGLSQAQFCRGHRLYGIGAGEARRDCSWRHCGGDPAGDGNSGEVHWRG